MSERVGERERESETERKFPKKLRLKEEKSEAAAAGFKSGLDHVTWSPW